jgi:uncharacterized protein
MATVNATALALTIIGGFNWLLVGLFNLNLIALILGSHEAGSRFAYVIIGVCSLYCLSMFRSVTNRRAAIDVSYARHKPSGY